MCYELDIAPQAALPMIDITALGSMLGSAVGYYSYNQPVLGSGFGGIAGAFAGIAFGLDMLT